MLIDGKLSSKKLKRKLNKAKQFKEIVSSYFEEFFTIEENKSIYVTPSIEYPVRNYELIEFCSGNNFASYYFSKDPNISAITVVDIYESREAKKINKKIKKPLKVCLHGLENLDLDKAKNSAVVAVHACGELTDRVIDMSIEHKLPFAVMTCCHSFRLIDRYLGLTIDHHILNYTNFQNYLDNARLSYIRSKGYFSVIEKINESVSKENRIIIGLPEKK